MLIHVGEMYSVNAAVSLLTAALIYGRIRLSPDKTAKTATAFVRMLICLMLFCLADAVRGLCLAGVISAPSGWIVSGCCILAALSSFAWTVCAVPFVRRSSDKGSALPTAAGFLAVCQILAAAYGVFDAEGASAQGWLPAVQQGFHYLCFLMVFAAACAVRSGAAMIFSAVPLVFGAAGYLLFGTPIYSLGLAFSAAMMFIFTVNHHDEADSEPEAADTPPAGTEEQYNAPSMRMKLSELTGGAELTVRIIWEHEMMEFPTMFVRGAENGVFITPHIHDGSPLRMTITEADNVKCSLFAVSYETGACTVWHNVGIETVGDDTHGIIYLVTADPLNQYSRPGERRMYERSPVSLPARVIDRNGRCANVTLGDISIGGLSFCAEDAEDFSFEPGGDASVSFCGTADGSEFNISIDTEIVRNFSEGSTAYCGCRVTDPPEDYKLYVFLHSLEYARQK